jgi:nudix-type nucleoside diphosphatase (YffH/AdpP family)
MSIADRVRIEDVTVLSDNWYVLRKYTIQFRRRDGTWQTQAREVYDRGDGAAVLLYDLDRRTVIVVRQFRLPAFVNGNDDLLIEVPAGVLDQAEPELRIRAEVEEEAGYRVGALEKVFEAFMSPGAVTERLHLYMARYSAADRISGGGGHPDEGEDIEVLEVNFDEAMSMVKSGAIRDAKTIMLLQHAALGVFGA